MNMTELVEGLELWREDMRKGMIWCSERKVIGKEDKLLKVIYNVEFDVLNVVLARLREVGQNVSER